MRKRAIWLTITALLALGLTGTAAAGPSPQQCNTMANRPHFPLGVNQACTQPYPPGKSGQAPGHLR